MANRYCNWTVLVTMIVIRDRPKNPVWCIFGFDQLETPTLDVKQGKLEKSIGMGPAQRKAKTENGNCTTTYLTVYDLNFHFSP